jgi:hypothetical protein
MEAKLKKVIVFFLMLAVGSTAFAQHFFIDGNVAANFKKGGGGM